MFTWFRPRRIYIVWESNPDPRGAASMENVFYSERKCQEHVARAQSAWAHIDEDVDVYYTTHIVID